MQLVLSVDSDPRQIDLLAKLVRDRLAVELIQATSAGEALQALGERVPDLIMTSPLLSPFDEGVLAEYLRELGQAATHVQTLRIPVIGAPKPKAGSLSFFKRKKKVEFSPDGCDPKFLADEIAQYLARAADEKAAVLSQVEHAARLEQLPAEPTLEALEADNLRYERAEAESSAGRHAAEPQAYVGYEQLLDHDVAPVYEAASAVPHEEPDAPLAGPEARPDPESPEPEAPPIEPPSSAARARVRHDVINSLDSLTLADLQPQPRASKRKTVHDERDARRDEPPPQTAPIAPVEEHPVAEVIAPPTEAVVRHVSRYDATGTTVPEPVGTLGPVDAVTYVDTTTPVETIPHVETVPHETVPHVGEVGQLAPVTQVDEVEPTALSPAEGPALHTPVRPGSDAAPDEIGAPRAALIDPAPARPDRGGRTDDIIEQTVRSAAVEVAAAPAQQTQAVAPEPVIPVDVAQPESAAAASTPQPATTGKAQAHPPHRRTATFEAALAAIRNAWGKPRHRDDKPSVTPAPAPEAPSEAPAIQAQAPPPPAAPPPPVAPPAPVDEFPPEAVPAREVDLAPAIEAIREPVGTIAPPEPVVVSPAPDIEAYELSASPELHDLESDIEAAAPPRVIPPSLPPTKDELAEQAGAPAPGSKTERRKTDKRKPGKPPKEPERLVQDEWGLFDPNQCGFAAVVEKLNEVTADSDEKAKTTVRVISYR